MGTGLRGEPGVSVVRLVNNLVPKAFSSIKMAVGETPGQGCWNTPRIVEYFVTWHMMKWLFRRLFPASGGKQNEDISLCLRDKILTNVWSHFGSLGQGFLRPPFWTRRRLWGRGWLVKEGLKIVLGPAPVLQRPMEENHAQVQLKRHGTVTSKWCVHVQCSKVK